MRPPSAGDLRLLGQERLRPGQPRPRNDPLGTLGRGLPSLSFPECGGRGGFLRFADNGQLIGVADIANVEMGGGLFCLVFYLGYRACAWYQHAI